MFRCLLIANNFAVLVSQALFQCEMMSHQKARLQFVLIILQYMPTVSYNHINL